MTPETPMFCAQISFGFFFELATTEAAFWITRNEHVGVVSVDPRRCLRRTFVAPEDAGSTHAGTQWIKINGVLRSDASEVEIRTMRLSTTAPYLEQLDENSAFTLFVASFEVPGECPQRLEPASTDRLIETAIADVRELVRVYRHLSGHVDVFLPSRDDSALIRVAVSNDYIFTEKELQGQFREVARIYGRPREERTGIGKSRLSNAETLTLARRLREGNSVRIFEELFSESRELSLIHDNHHLAIVTAEAGFETYLQWRLAIEYEARGILALADSDEAMKQPENVFLNLSVRELLEHAKALAGRSVKEGREHDRWRFKAYNVRHDIVHRGRSDVSARMYEDAAAAMLSYAKCLDGILLSTRPASP
jgi:hypothetical protein